MANVFELDRNRMILEQFEEETVLVNIESGYYYSLSPTGSEILELLEEGCSAEELAAVLFGDSENLDRSQAVERFVEQLAAENIIVARGSERASSNGFHRGSARYGSGAKYEPPTLERFDDVRDLLLIDPVHQVDREFGWPKKAADSIEPRA